MFASSNNNERKPRYAGGPHGLGMRVHLQSINYLFISICPIEINSFIIYLGDPDDYTLRKIEQNVVIMKIVRETAKYEKCSEDNKSNFF